MLNLNEKLVFMNRQFFNKKEMVILPESNTDSVFNERVSRNVLAGMLANFERLGYRFSEEDISVMSKMSENTLVEQVYHPVLDAMKAAKGDHVVHNILFPDFPNSVRALDIDTLSDFRFMSYFTVLYDEYIREENAFKEGSLTNRIMDYLRRIATEKTDRKKVVSEGTDLQKPIEAEEKPSENLITVRLGTMNDYYQMVRNMLSGKSSLSEYDKDIVRFALANITRNRFMPDIIPFKENWALVAQDDFENGRYSNIDIKSIKDFERFLAALTPGSDLSLSQKQQYRNFSNRERKALYFVFTSALKRNEPIMTETAIPRHAKSFIRQTLRNRLHFNQMKDGYIFKDFVEHVDTLRSKMSHYEEFLIRRDYVKAAQVLAGISPGVLLDHAKTLVAKAENEKDLPAVNGIFEIVKENCRNAPMDKLLTLRRIVESNISREEESVKFRFKRSSRVAVVPFPNRSLKMSEETKDEFSRILKDIILEQLSVKEEIGKIYIDSALKNCPIPVVGRSDSGKNRTVAAGTKIPFGTEKNILRAALYKKGDRNGFFDFSCAFLNRDYRFLGQISWNNLKEDKFAYHSGDCNDTKRGVTEIIDIDLSTIQERFPEARYVVYEGMAWAGFTTVDKLEECFLTLSSVEQVGEDIFGAGKNPLNPAKVKFRVDLTGNTIANIPILYDLVKKEVSILNMAVTSHLTNFGENGADQAKRHFDLPADCVAIENYAGELAQTAYYINERLMQDKPSIFDLAMLNAEARNGEIVQNKEDADVIFSIDREEVKDNRKIITIYDKDVLNTEYMVPVM